MSFNKPIEDYFQRKFEERLAVQLPRWDKVYVTPISLLLTKQKELQEIERNLRQKRIFYQQKKADLEARWNDLDTKEILFRDNISKFDKFLKENEVKRERAEKKAGEERELQQMKDIDIQRLHNEISQLEDIEAILENKVEMYSIYESFLNKAVEASNTFHEIREIIDRYVILIMTHDLLMERASAVYEAVDENRSGLSQMIQEESTARLLHGNELSRLQSELDKTQAETAKLESIVSHIKATAAQKTLMLGQIKVATHNLYLLTCKQMGNPPTISIEDTPGQIGAIDASLVELTRVLKDANTLVDSEGGGTAHTKDRRRR